MARAFDVLRSGEWLTRERIRLVAAAVLIAGFAGLLYLVLSANGLNDVKGRPLGTDFSSFYAAGSYVLDGQPQAPYDVLRQHAREQEIFGAATPFYSFAYPPVFLFIAAALALLPYGAALALWQAVTLCLYLLMIWGVLRPSLRAAPQANPGAGAPGFPPPSSRRGLWARWRWLPHGRIAASGTPYDWLLLALGFPAVLVNLGHGQNGFLTAALLGGALVALNRRPLLAGILFGLLAYKPQFGIMIPFALAASERWRSMAAAAATVAALVLATTLAFGPDVWPAFLHAGRFARLVVLEQGDVGWYKMQSLFAWARMWHAAVPLAYALQGALSVAVGAALVWLWRSAAPYRLKAASLCLAAILATPFVLDYDMMVLAPAIAFFAADGCERGFRPWEKTALAAVWLAPLVARGVAQATLIPLGAPAMLAIFILLLRRSRPERAAAAPSPRLFFRK
jgi:alpha-1,2-mannosyltransferase